MSIRHIIFDFDGTLVNTHEAITWTILKTLPEVGLDVTEDTPRFVRELIGAGLTLGSTLQKLGIAEELIEPAKASYRELYAVESLSRMVLFDGVHASLQSLNDQGKNLIVFSNKGLDALVQALEVFDIRRHFTHLVAEVRGVEPKPSPETFEKIIHPFYPESRRQNFLMVGDTNADLEFARNSGILSCWVTYGFGNPVICKELNPNIVIDRFIDLPKSLDLLQVNRERQRRSLEP